MACAIGRGRSSPRPRGPTLPDWIIATGYQVGGAGAVLLLAALWALHKGWWYTARTVRILENRIAELTLELALERKEHREDNLEAERRVFNALGVADKVAGVVHEAVNRARRAA